MSARDMSRRGTVGGGRARFQPRARGANRSFRGRGSAFLSVSSCFSSRKPAFDWELLPLLLRFVRGALSLEIESSMAMKMQQHWLVAI